MWGLSPTGRLPRRSGAEVKRTHPLEPGRLIGNAYLARLLRVRRNSGLRESSNVRAHRCSLSTGAATNCESERGQGSGQGSARARACEPLRAA